MASTLKPGGTIEPKVEEGRRGASASACVIVSLDGARLLAPPSRHWLAGVDEVRIGRSATDERIPDRPTARVIALRLPDAMVSATHATVRRSRDQWTIVDESSRNGTAVNGQRIRERRLVDGDAITLGRICLVFRVAELDSGPERRDESADDLYPRGLPRGLWTMSPSLEREFADAVRMARSRSSVLIMGETGTGKELAANAIHKLSERPGAFVPVNCGALPADLVAGEMFGHRRGAFSGAVADKEGLVTASSGGTLFLDEIGELPPAMQAAMLRALQDGEVRPVGATRATTVDLRVVAATHVDLHARVRGGAFREDLLSRLLGYVLRLPALRDRKEDIGLLVRSMFGSRSAGGEVPALSAEATTALVGHAWPRNVRQLEQALEQGFRRSDGAEVQLHHLPADVRARPAKGRDELIELLRKHRGNTVRAAEEEGVSRQAIEKRCRTLDIDYKAFRNDVDEVDDADE